MNASSTDSGRTHGVRGPARSAAGGHSAAARNLQWLLANLVEEVPGVRSVAVISSDGLLLCSSEIDEEETRAVTQAAARAERLTDAAGSGMAGDAEGGDGESADAPGNKSSGDLATVVSGLASLTDGAARLMDAGPVKQSVVAMENGCLFVMSISDGSLLGVHASPECDMSVVAYHMALFVGRAGHVLTPELRSELAGPPLPGDRAAEGGR